MEILTNGLGIQMRPKDNKSEQSCSYDSLFDSLINLESINTDCGDGDSRAISLAEDELANILNSRISQNEREQEEAQNSPMIHGVAIATVKADQDWTNALPTLNRASSSLGASYAPLERMYDFSLADNSSCVSPNILQIGLHAPHNSLCNSPSSSPSSLFSLSQKFQSLYVHENQQLVSSPPQLTLRTALSYETARPSLPMMNALQQQMSLGMYRPETTYDSAMAMNSAVHFRSPPSNPELDMSQLDITVGLSPVGRGYVQHPNTPNASPPLMTPNSSSSSSIGALSVEMPIENFPTVGFTHVNPEIIMQPQPTRPSITSPAWGLDNSGAGQPEFRGKGNSNRAEHKAQPEWLFDNDGIFGPQISVVHRQSQQGRSTNSINLPKSEMPIEESSSGVMGMRTTNQMPMRHGCIVETDSITRSNHRSPVNSASASSTSRSCHAVNFLLEMSPAQYPELMVQQKSQTNPQPWSPTTLLYPSTPTQKLNGAKIPIRNASRNSGNPPHPKVADMRPALLFIPNNEDRSPSPCQSPGYGNGKTSQNSTRGCRSSAHRRRKSSCGSTSPRHALDGFVNLTPKDSHVLLTGVAPSGSSKTKLRREREEKEKRRKFGEAAEKLVLQAAHGEDLRNLKQGIQALKSVT